LSQISAPRHLILQVRAIQTKDQATRNGGVHLEEQEKQARQKVAGTAQKYKKNDKSKKAAAATNFPLLLYAASRMPPKKVFKRRGPGSLPIYLISPHIHSHSIPSATPQKPSSSTVQHPTFPPFSLYSSIGTRSNLRLNKELHQELHQELHHELQDLPQEPQDHKMNMAPRI
jgi:hypothetical protein